jgi:predicted house-cleaning noncanonical NTP pyrophosphatase (MazG superfamily)
MKKFSFKKLVRDNVLEAMLKDQEQNPNYRTLSDDEFLIELKKKLLEEVYE